MDKLFFRATLSSMDQQQREHKEHQGAEWLRDFALARARRHAASEDVTAVATAMLVAAVILATSDLSPRNRASLFLESEQ